MSAEGAGTSQITLALLPHAGRQGVTCRYRCGDQCAHETTNTSDNEYFGQLAQKALSRRGALRATVIVAASAAGTAATDGFAGTASALTDEPMAHSHAIPGTNFVPVPANTADAVTIPEKYAQSVVIRWGDPVTADAPDFDFNRQTAAAQEKQFGYNNDFAALLPLDSAGLSHLLVVNHEYTSEPFMFRGYDENNVTEEQVRIAWAAHGLSVVMVVRHPDSEALRPVPSRYNRRITLTTPFRMTGPAAGSELLQTSADPSGLFVLGTQNNCAGGKTPWGTVLSGEENFHQYFANSDGVTDSVTRERLKRYGFSGMASDRKWERFDRRFDAREEPNETNRFGWIVEVDPHDPFSVPVKHTALGRFKHEGATVSVTADNRVVAYLGDDEAFEYIYKFVSDGTMKSGMSAHARRHNMRLLDSGTLYVARFNGDSGQLDGSGKLPVDGEFDGSGHWIALAHNNKSFVAGMSAEEVYVFTRIAADRMHPTKMDRPEDIETNPINAKVYCALTNNTDRGTAGATGPDEANPRNRNKHGHVLELTEESDNPAAARFTWSLFLVCGDPNSPNTYFGGFPKDQVSAISCPDNLAFDRYGNLWISTDGNELGSNDGLYAVPVRGAERGRVKRFLTVPRGAETCGPVITDSVVTVCVQHPGEIDGASAENPASHWPDGGGNPPRPAVVAVYKDS